MNELAIWAVAGFGFLAATGWGLLLTCRSVLPRLTDVIARLKAENQRLREQLKHERRERLATPAIQDEYREVIEEMRSELGDPGA